MCKAFYCKVFFPQNETKYIDRSCNCNWKLFTKTDILQYPIRVVMQAFPAKAVERDNVFSTQNRARHIQFCHRSTLQWTLRIL